jgi:hypothetical protein
MQTPFSRGQLRLVQGSLAADDGPASHRGTYRDRGRERRDEIAAVLACYPIPRRGVDNVIPLRKPPTGPDAA